MAKKDIARSALEGGRYNGFEKKLTHRERRVKERAYLRRVEKDPDAATAGAAPRNRKVYKEFTDKLGPAYRWLAKQVGRKWDDVYSELKAKYDIRSLNGYHIVVQHLLPQVYGAKQESRFTLRLENFEYLVSDSGVLVRNPKFWRYKKNKPKGPSRAQVADKIGRRLVGVKDEKLFWLRPKEGDGWTECVTKPPSHLVWEPDTKKWQRPAFQPSHRYFWHSDCTATLHSKHPDHKYYMHAQQSDWQIHREFSKGEVKWWRSVDEGIKSKFILFEL